MKPNRPPFPLAWLPALLPALILVGCAAAPNVPMPATTVPAQWHEQAAAAALTRGAPPADAPWWQAFGDETANRWVALALGQNPDTLTAALRARAAALRVDTASAALNPTPTGSLSVGTSRTLQPLGPVARTAGTSWGVSWELDLWGRLALQRNLADWEATASADDLRAARSALAGQVLRQMWQWAALGQRIEQAEASLAYARETVRLTQSQYDAGAISGLDLAQAKQGVDAQTLALDSLRQQRTEAGHQLSLALGLPPGELPADAASLALPPARAVPVAPDVPAQWLARRPDLRAAEQRLRIALGRVDDTRLSFYPTIGLNGGLSTGGASLAQWLANPAASLGAGLSLPFLSNWGEMQRAPQVAQLEYEQAVLGFKQTLHRAMAEVETAFANVAMLEAQRGLQADVLARAARIEAMTQTRYRAGAIALRDWLATQEALRLARQQAVDADLNWLLAQVALLQALGGDAGG